MKKYQEAIMAECDSNDKAKFPTMATLVLKIININSYNIFKPLIFNKNSCIVFMERAPQGLIAIWLKPA